MDVETGGPGRPAHRSIGGRGGTYCRSNAQGPPEPPQEPSIRVFRMAPKRDRPPMSDEHKAALAEGRNQGRSVRRYLEALEAHKPKRGRKRTPESMQKRLDRIDVELAGADPLKRLQLIQERLDLASELEAVGEKVDLSGLEQAFVDGGRGVQRAQGHLVRGLARAGRGARRAEASGHQPGRARSAAPGGAGAHEQRPQQHGTVRGARRAGGRRARGAASGRRRCDPRCTRRRCRRRSRSGCRRSAARRGRRARSSASVSGSQV